MTDLLSDKAANRRVPNFRLQAGRRDQILDAALEVFFSKGYERSRIEDVAKLSGIGKSAVLYHFGTKLALVSDVVATHCLPADPISTGPAEAVIEASLAQPGPTKVLRLVMTEQLRLPLLGRLYVTAILRRVSSWQGFDSVEAVRASFGRAFGSMATRVLFEGYPIQGEHDATQPV